jgi:L-methionine (R)-S-oxide reductase
MTSPTLLSETVQKNARPEIADWLADFVQSHGGLVGSVHLPAGDDQLALVAAYNLAPSVQNGAAIVPLGKGLAGAAADRKAPVALSDLQTDTSGVARPRACDAESKGSVTVPVLAEDGTGAVLAIVGLGFTAEREFTEEEIARYTAHARKVVELPTSRP